MNELRCNNSSNFLFYTINRVFRSAINVGSYLNALFVSLCFKSILRTVTKMTNSAISISPYLSANIRQQSQTLTQLAVEIPALTRALTETSCTFPKANSRSESLKTPLAHFLACEQVPTKSAWRVTKLPKTLL